MKNAIKIVPVGLAIVMSFAAVQASGDMEAKKGPKSPNVELTLEVVPGCVLSLHDDSKDGITLCSDIEISNDGPIDCPEDGDDDCNACGDGNVTTILGIGPAFYWENAVTLEMDGSCLPEFDNDQKYTVIEETAKIPQPAPGDHVTIGYYPSPDGEDLIALWVVVKTDDGATAVLLRDQETLDVLWKGIGKNKKGKKKTTSEE